MSKNKRKKPNNDAVPMEVDEVETNINVGASSESEDEDRHISEDEEGGIRLGDIYIPPAPKPALTFDSSGPRLIITHIINENFKSYAGSQHLGPFHKSFTSIIGPNGSGKSNVIDSMLFVFGYRANKIRSKKIEGLIHHSDRNSNCKSATVTVHFQKIIDGPGESYTVVPGSELKVSRTAFKDNTSYYELNGQRVKFKEVATMLRSQGIDLDHNRFLILQGEIEQIALMKPKGVSAHDYGMLEYLEEIIGTSRYKVPIEKLSEKVEELTDKRKEKLNRVRAVESEKSKLEQPMREAVELMNMSNQTTVLRNLLLQKYLYEVRKMTQEKENLKAKAEIELQEVETRIVQINQEIQEKNLVLKEGSRKLDVFNREKDAIKKRLYAIVQKSATVKLDIKNATEKSQNLRQLIKQEKSKLIEYEQIPEKNARDIEECEKMLEKHNENLERAEEEKQTVEAGNIERTRGLNEGRERFTTQLSGLKRILDEAKTARDLAQRQLNIYNSSKTDIAKLEKGKADYSNAKSQLERNKQIKDELTTSLPQKEKELKELETKLQNYQRQETEIQSEVRSLRSQLEESKQRMSAKSSRNDVLNWVMKQKRDGTIPGIFARMGDLGRIDREYDTAVSVAFPALDNVLTDTVATGTACINGLKRLPRGTCGFIALDKQAHLIGRYEQKKKYPQNVPRLFDLVTVADKRVLPAFYYIMQETLFANNIEQARKIAYGNPRYRVVTRTGEVIEIVGTLTGGRINNIRSRMGTSVQEDTRAVDTAAIQATEQKLTDLEQSLNNMRSEKRVMEAQIITLQKTIREGKDTLNKVNLELKDLIKRVPTLKNQIDELERKITASQAEDRTAELESTVAEAQERVDKAEFDVGEVMKELTELDDQIRALSSAGVIELDKKIKNLANKIKKLGTEISRLTAGIATNARKVQISTANVASMEADLIQTEKKLENLNTQLKQVTLDNAQQDKEMEEIDVKINEIPSQFVGVKEQKAKLEEKMKKVKDQMIDLSAQISGFQKNIADYASKRPTLEKDLQNLELETIEPDDTGIIIPGLEDVEPLKAYTDEDLQEANIDELRAKVSMNRQRMGENKPNTGAVKEYRAKEAMYLQRAAELEAITGKRNEARQLYDDLKKRRQTEFMSGFNIITAKLKEMYQMITLGGDAELELVDSLDPFTEGIIFSVRPPSKSWKNIQNLSGGEKTLSSLALVFALHYYKPTPVYVMDEIDAALDFKNVSIVANYIKERTKNAQFIIISLRYIMFEVSNRLVGIYKTQDCTRSICVENRHELPEEIAESMDRDE